MCVCVCVVPATIGRHVCSATAQLRNTDIRKFPIRCLPSPRVDVGRITRVTFCRRWYFLSATPSFSEGGGVSLSLLSLSLSHRVTVISSFVFRCGTIERTRAVQPERTNNGRVPSMTARAYLVSTRRFQIWPTQRH